MNTIDTIDINNNIIIDNNYILIDKILAIINSGDEKLIINNNSNSKDTRPTTMDDFYIHAYNTMANVCIRFMSNTFTFYTFTDDFITYCHDCCLGIKKYSEMIDSKIYSDIYNEQCINLIRFITNYVICGNLEMVFLIFLNYLKEIDKFHILQNIYGRMLTEICYDTDSCDNIHIFREATAMEILYKPIINFK